MTDQEINTAIAEACGITMIPCTCTHWPWKDAKTGRHTLAYTTDLNAMHDAEKVLMGPQWRNYAQELQDLPGAHCIEVVPDYYRDQHSLSVLVHATSRQRAEAFLRTIGKWKD